MNEPFLPLPLPNPPEEGYGRILSGATRYVVGRLRRRPASPSGAPCRRAPEPRLASRSAGREPGGGGVRFPLLPPAEF